MVYWTVKRPPGLRPRKPAGMPRPGDGDEGPSTTSRIPAADGAGTQPTSRCHQSYTTPVQHSPKDPGSTNTSYQPEETLDQHSPDTIGDSSFHNFHQVQEEPDQNSTGLDPASQRSDLQLEEDLNKDPPPNGCDSCKDFHQIHDALARIKTLPTGSGDTNSSDQLEDSSHNGCPSCKVFHQIQSALTLIQFLPPDFVQSTTLRLNGSLVQPLPTVSSNDIFHGIQRAPVEVSPAAPGPANSSDQLEEWWCNYPWIFPWNVRREISPLRRRLETLSIFVCIACFCFRWMNIEPFCL